MPEEIWTQKDLDEYHKLHGEAKVAFAERLNHYRTFANTVELSKALDGLAAKGAPLSASRYDSPVYTVLPDTLTTFQVGGS